MKSECAIDSVQSAVSRLKADGLMQDNRKIKHKRPRQKQPNFWTFMPTKVIKYYGDCSSFSEEELMFCFLHEESHLKYPQNKKQLMTIWLIIIASTIVFFLMLLINCSGIPSIYLLLIFLPAFSPFMLTPIFRKKLMKDETEADYHASLLLRDHYGIKEPSVVVEKALGRFPELSYRHGYTDRTINRIMSTYPTHSERVGLIRETVDLE